MTDLNFNSALDVVNFLETHNSKLIINVATDAVGHVLAEFDNFACMQALGDVSASENHLYIGPREERVATVMKLYGDSLTLKSWLSPLAPEIARSIALFRPDLTVDVGISSVKIAPAENVTTISIADDFVIYRPDSYGRMLDDFVAYYRRKLDAFTMMQTRSLFTMPEGELRQFQLPADLESLIDSRGRRLALIQIKASKWHSGGAGATDVSSYLPALEYLREMDYQLVQVGREYYPSAFARLGVVNYSNSPLASFENDFFLFSNAGFSLTAPSGIALFSDLMMTPYVVTNNWWHGVPPFSPYAVSVPALARLRKDGSMLTFDEQNQLAAAHGVNFPKESHEPISPDGTDILAATIEALDLRENLTMPNDNQLLYRQLPTPPGLSSICSPYCLSRISAAYAERHRHLLCPE